jgi:hypothetical protein
MVGKRFGLQVVVRELEGGYFEVKCDCGTTRSVRGQYLRSGQSRSCGCARYADRVAPLEVGQRHEKLVVLERLGTDGKQRRILVQCDCGTRKILREADFRRGDIKSCGCYRKQRMAVANLKHGEGSPTKRSALYRTWSSMWQRTTRTRLYPTYAPRGIRVCDEWRDFVAFRDYVLENLGPRPRGQTLDRIDNDRGYEPGNIKWATATEQARNRSCTILFTVDGVTKSAAEWSEQVDIAVTTMVARRRQGWSDKMAVFTPLREESRKKR